MAIRIALMIWIFSSIVYILRISDYTCLNILVWEFCGAYEHADLIYMLVGFDLLLALYILMPFFTFGALRHVIKSKNTTNKNK